MSRCSQCRKAISPEPIIISDEDDFVAVASDDKYVASHFCCHQSFHFVIFYSLEDNIDNQDHGKNTTKPARKYGPFVPFVKKKSGATQDVESDNVMYIAFTLLSSLLFLLLLPQNRNYTTPYTISCQSNQWEETCCSQ